MLRVEVLAVGRELLIGKTLNTNAHWVGGRLSRMGTMISRMTTADDDLREIAAALRDSLSREPDFVVVLGGLGPTPDDMTLRGVAMALGRRVAFDRRALALMMEHYAQAGMDDVKVTPARRKMATIPTGSDPLRNEVGTAPGVRLVAGACVLFCLPGVPAEMKDIFRRSVEPEVRARLGKLYRARGGLKLEGIYEAAVAPLIAAELKRNPGAYIKSHPKGRREGVSRLELDIVSVKEERADAERTVEGIVARMAAAMEKRGGRIKSRTGVAARVK